MENTAATSVDETTAPIKKDSISGSPVIQLIKSPTAIVVIKTPKIESVTPLHRTGFISTHLVFNLPEKRMKMRAIIPMNCVVGGLSNKSHQDLQSLQASLLKGRKSMKEFPVYGKFCLL